MIHYRAGYKYQLTRDLMVETSIRPGAYIANAFCVLESDGKLFIRSGYAWDGASGPMMDTPTVMRASCVHDALYQFMREGMLSRDLQTAADWEFYRICRASGMSSIRALYSFCAVQLFGSSSTDPAHDRMELTAP
jgi:hypothetical protein